MIGVIQSIAVSLSASLILWIIKPNLKKFEESHPTLIQNFRRSATFIIISLPLISVAYYFGQVSVSEQRDDRAIAPQATATSATPVNYKKTESGPDRASFSNDNPPTKPTLNTVHDYPDWGNEQDFVRVSDGKGQLRNAVSVSNGERYKVVVFVKNDATGSNSTALNTRLKIHVPNKIKTGSEPITAVLTSDNTTHKKSGIVLPFPI